MLSRHNRPGMMNGPWVAFLASVLVLAGLIGLLVWEDSRETDTRPLVVYCAAGLKPPVEQAAREYEELYGVPIHLTYEGSATLLSKIAVAKRGDLYVPADNSYIETARAKGLLAEDIPLARMTPVLAVAKGNPEKIDSLNDLLKRKDLRIAQANPDAAAVGKLTKQALEKSGRWEALRKRTRVFKGTVNEVANDIKIGSVDAGIVWDATARQYPDDLEMIRLPELKEVSSDIRIGVLRSCERPASALRFARFLAARDRGLLAFKQHGYEPAEGDLWADGEPLITIYAGAMLRPAVQETIKEFAAREGLPEANVRVVYNGCGILVGQMKVKRDPDAFFACDANFMKQVKDLFIDEVTVSTNQLVILVHKGNPKGIHSLKDLLRGGMRVGVGNEHQCAMGVLTRETFRRAGMEKKVKHNVVVESATGDMLVNQMLAAPSKLDAVIAYVSNGKAAADRLEAIPIDLPCAVATQPIAVGRQSDHKHLVGRLMQAILSKQSRERFEQFGFKWKAAAE